MMAARGSSTSNNLEDLLHCMICFDAYCNPKMLKCGHTFCADCVQGYFRTYQQQRKALPGKLPCPTCRDYTTLPASGVGGLRNDFKVKKIEEMFKTVRIKDRVTSKVCDPCRSQTRASPAKRFCVNCGMNYCDTCLPKHDRNPLFKNHQLVDKNGKDNSSQIFCREHQDEQGNFFCQTCEVVICTLCIMSAHEDHNVVEVADMFNENKDVINDLQGVVNNKVHQLDKKRKELEDIKLLNVSSCQQAEDEIKDTANAMINSIRRQETELIEEIRQKRDEKLDNIDKEIDSAGFHKAKASSLQDFADSSTKRFSVRMMAIHEELIQRMKTVVDVDGQPTTPGEDTFSVITFLPARDDPILGRIDDMTGSVDELSRKITVISTPSLPLPAAAAAIPERPISNGITNYDVQPTMILNIDKIGSAVGEIRDPLSVVGLLNGDIVVTEWGNKRLQIFDSVGKSVRIIGSGKIGPQGVAITLKGNIMITDAQNKRLEVFTPSGNSIARWGLGKFFGPCGLALSPNGNCLVTDIAEHTLNIYKGEKKCLRRFGSRGNKDDQFNNPLYVAAGLNNEIIVSDSNNHCLKMYDSHGRFARRIGSEGNGDGQLKYPRGVCSDYNGHILVADRNNNRVSMFSRQGRFLRHILTKKDGIRDPYGLAISVTKNLIVTESSNDRAAIKVFVLKPQS